MKPSTKKLTHIDGKGQARMVDVGRKRVTRRRAVVEGRVRVSSELAQAIATNGMAKGNLLETARLAGLQAAKRTSELIPLCHNIPLDHVAVEARLERGAVLLRAEVVTSARTGVEMEAFTAVAAAALTVVDMGKALDKTMVIEGIRLLEKGGGRSGTWRRPARV
jgi:cyclic pyranopterin phosphate synthase